MMRRIRAGIDLQGAASHCFGHTFGTTLTATPKPTPTVKPLDDSTIAIALAIDTAYLNAKYPSTVHINSVYYQDSLVNGYGDTVSRTLVKAYGMNDFGGYGNIFAVVLKVPNSPNYTNKIQFLNGYYTRYLYNSNPGINNMVRISNTVAQNAYLRVYGRNAKAIPFD